MSVTKTETLATVNPLFQLEFVKRIQKLALVHSSVQLVEQSYAKLKSSNSLFTNTLDQAEKSFQLVANNVAYPVINQFESPLHYADNLVCNSFDKIQEKIAVLNKSSEELKEYSYKYYDNTSKRIQAVKKQTLDKVNTVFAVSDNLVKSVDTTLKSVEGALEYLLPADDVEIVEESSNSNNGETNLKRIISRMGRFSERVRRRLVAYTKQKLVPAVFDSVFVLKDTVLSRTTATTKLLTNGDVAKKPEAADSSQ